MEQVFIRKNDLNRWVAKYFPSNDLISIDDLIGVIEELDEEVEQLKEKIEDMEQDLEQNYRPIPLSEQYGIRNSDFY